MNCHSDLSVGLQSSSLLLALMDKILFPPAMLSSFWIRCSVKLGYRAAEMLLLVGSLPFEWFSGAGQYQEL